MRLLVLSDLHLEFGNDYSPPECLPFDAVILAGDIHTKGRGVVWAQERFVCPVIYVPGNHEYYGSEFSAMRSRLRAAGGASCVHVLDREVLMLEEGISDDGMAVRILGTTLWTDFELPYRQSDGVSSHPGGAMFHAFTSMEDYAEINDGLFKIKPSKLLAEHQLSLAWLKDELAKPWLGKTVVVTHHGPSARSVHHRFIGDCLSPSFVSDLSAEIFEGVDLWVHGHVHDSFDYLVGGARVVSNPRGYCHWTGQFENASYEPGLVVQI